MVVIFKIAKKALADIGERELFFGEVVTDEIEFDTGLIATELSVWIECPVVGTAGFALFSNITILVEEL